MAGLPSNQLKGMHDMAVFDINGDGWKDIVAGRCVGTRIFMNVPPAGAAGVVDGYDNSTQLQLSMRTDGDIDLNWGASCELEDTDYAVYSGRMVAPFNDHTEVTCTTGGATSHTVTPGLDNFYYLVVPHNGVLEGSYGEAAPSVERPQGASACFPQLTGACE